MGWYDRLIGIEERAPAKRAPDAAEQRMANPMENPTVPLGGSAEDLFAFFGLLADRKGLPNVTLDNALEVPAVLAAVGFLSRAMATLPLHAFRGEGETSARVGGDLDMLLNEAPNSEWSSHGFRRWFWQQVFTGGRGLAWIEFAGTRPLAIWPMDPGLTTLARRKGRTFYRFEGREYPAAEVIDVPFMLKPNGLDHLGPINRGRKAIGLAMAMDEFAAGFFAGGGVPPLSLEGPLPSGQDAMNRALESIKRTVEHAKKANSPMFGMPPGHSLKAVGLEPAKGQMVEARLFQIQEIARIYGLPPVFLQDLSKGTFSNTEQQDLQLVKHVIQQWAKAFEDELNLKLFGQRRRARYVRHNLDGVMRGDFRSRVEGIARQIQTGQLTPNEARALEDRAPMDQGDRLYVQGATVPLGTVQGAAAAGPSIEDQQTGDEPENETMTEDGTDAGTED